MLPGHFDLTPSGTASMQGVGSWGSSTRSGWNSMQEDGYRGSKCNRKGSPEDPSSHQVGVTYLQAIRKKQTKNFLNKSNFEITVAREVARRRISEGLDIRTD
ncbi:Uncharacterised protein g5011 [Pycnogonum litorale]